MPVRGRKAVPTPDTAHQQLRAELIGNGDDLSRETAWIEVIRKMDENYADLVRYQVELEGKNSELEEAQRLIAQAEEALAAGSLLEATTSYRHALESLQRVPAEESVARAAMLPEVELAILRLANLTARHDAWDRNVEVFRS